MTPIPVNLFPDPTFTIRAFVYDKKNELIDKFVTEGIDPQYIKTDYHYDAVMKIVVDALTAEGLTHKVATINRLMISYELVK